LCCISFPAGIFRSIQIQYTIIVVVIALFLFSGRNIPSNTNTIHIDYSILFSGRNIPSNTNTIHIYCCVCVVFTFRPEFSVKYKYNKHLLLCCISFPAGIFRSIQIQYTIIVVIALFLFSGRNIPSNTNTIHIDCCVCVAFTFRPEFSGWNTPSNTNTIHSYCCLVCVASTFRPEYSVQYKYNTHLLLCCISFPAGIFRSIQIQYTIIVVVIAFFLFSGRNIPSNTNTIHIDCCVCVAFTFRPENSGRNILSNTNTMHIYC